MGSLFRRIFPPAPWQTAANVAAVVTLVVAVLLLWRTADYVVATQKMVEDNHQAVQDNQKMLELLQEQYDREFRPYLDVAEDVKPNMGDPDSGGQSVVILWHSLRNAGLVPLKYRLTNVDITGFPPGSHVGEPVVVPPRGSANVPIQREARYLTKGQREGVEPLEVSFTVDYKTLESEEYEYRCDIKYLAHLNFDATRGNVTGKIFFVRKNCN